MVTLGSGRLVTECGGVLVGVVVVAVGRCTGFWVVVCGGECRAALVFVGVICAAYPGIWGRKFLLTCRDLRFRWPFRGAAWRWGVTLR